MRSRVTGVLDRGLLARTARRARTAAVFVREAQLTGGEVDRVGHDVEVVRRADLVDVEPEAVRHHDDLTARTAQGLDERPEPRIEGDFPGRRPQGGLVGRHELPLVDEAFAAADGARLVLLVQLPPLGAREPVQQVHADVGRRDRPVEVEEDRGALEIDVEVHEPRNGSDRSASGRGTR